MYTEMEHAVLFCTVSRPRAGDLAQVVAQADPNAFLVIGHGHQATGGRFGQVQRRARKVSRLAAATAENRAEREK
jgi:hypothetical protein